MTIEGRRILSDRGGQLAPIVDGLHDIGRAFGDRRFAIVGGLAVLTHVQGHRVTTDIDSAVRGLRPDVRAALLAVADRARRNEADGVLANNVPVDLLVVSPRPPRPGTGLREMKAHSASWAIETAERHEIACEPANPRGPVTVPVARVSALIAMKTVAIVDGQRGDKAATDRLDLWRLLSVAPDRAALALTELADAPPRLSDWVGRKLEVLLRADPAAFVEAVASVAAAAPSVSDVVDIWEAVVAPSLGAGD